ncbi:kinesin-like protein KIF25 isoform X2 [Corticium candelabrum]|nr:kinesin-like protein KIF25 isoform X2 [Corticium candelabrum]
MDEVDVELKSFFGYKRMLLAKDERITALETENAMLHLKLAESHGNVARLRKANSSLCCLLLDANEFRKSLAPRLEEVNITIKILREQLDVLRSIMAAYLHELSVSSQRVDTSIGQLMERTNESFMSRRIAAETDRQLVGMQRQLSDVTERYQVEKCRRRSLHNTLVELRGNIRVYCRVRPELSFDRDDDNGDSSSATGLVVTAMDEETVCFQPVRQNVRGELPPVKMFEYDRVYSPDCGQSNVFDDVKPLLTSLLDGYNVCVMAYGQTGSGKTYTMLGKEDYLQPSYDDFADSEEIEDREGVVPRSARELFRLLEERRHEYLSFAVDISAIEIYNNQIRDLLDKELKTHNVVSGKDGEMEMPNVKTKPVSCVSEVMRHVLYSMKRRVEDATLIHEHSSRSHLIVTLTVTAVSRQATMIPLSALATRVVLPDLQLTPPSSPNRQKSQRRSAPHSTTVSPLVSPPPLCNSSFADFSVFSSSSGKSGGESGVFRTKLQLVDLAGSECVGMSGVTGMGLRESSFINRSLSALADVLGALGEHRGHVPYRNSKLTYLLQDSIGGDAKLLMLLCVSPSHRYMAESLQTLGFGSRARQVQRGPVRRRKPLLLQSVSLPSSPGRQASGDRSKSSSLFKNK